MYITRPKENIYFLDTVAPEGLLLGSFLAMLYNRLHDMNFTSKVVQLIRLSITPTDVY